MKPVPPSLEPPSFLIVVPTLNSFSLLPHLISSLQHQSWSHWRLLFVDGPSCADHRQWLCRICEEDPRCFWQEQEPGEVGIFGAMNQGFAAACSHDWLLFWGSDDWAASSIVLAKLAAVIERFALVGHRPDLIVGQGRYADDITSLLGRRAVFSSSGCFTQKSFRSQLFWGATPPHQGTLFGPGARHRIRRYEEGFRLSADLDYFLRISQTQNLQVEVLDLELVHMAEGGVSGQQTKRRLKEVWYAYRQAFGFLCWFPFLVRYGRRFISSISVWR